MDFVDQQSWGPLAESASRVSSAEQASAAGGNERRGPGTGGPNAEGDGPAGWDAEGGERHSRTPVPLFPSKKVSRCCVVPFCPTKRVEQAQQGTPFVALSKVWANVCDRAPMPAHSSL